MLRMVLPSLLPLPVCMQGLIPVVGKEFQAMVYVSTIIVHLHNIYLLGSLRKNRFAFTSGGIE